MDCTDYYTVMFYGLEINDLINCVSIIFLRVSTFKSLCCKLKLVTREIIVLGMRKEYFLFLPKFTTFCYIGPFAESYLPEAEKSILIIIMI